MAAIIAFSVSFVALVFFLVFKLFEHKHGLPAYTVFRKKADAATVSAARNVIQHGERLEKQLSVRNVTHVTVHHAAAAVASVARKVEAHADDVTRKMMRNGKGDARTTKSPFLHEVATHKEGLDTDRVRRETSLTEDSKK